YHYDTGNEFFATFLDERMVYSCAHFLGETESLDDAQERKLDLICRKLELSEGMDFLDVGCGWGGLVIHAASRFGVRATGITLSPEQAQYARIRVKELDLEDRVEILELDYRDLTGTFDAIASVGMFEHVGGARLSTYFEKLRSVLAPGGQLLNHGITNRNRDLRRRRNDSFVGRYVFPDGDLRPVEESIELAERAGFELRDIEAMRMSYALTLRRWVERLESNRNLAIEYSSEKTYRVWRAYMAGSAIAFEQGAIGLYQLLLSDPERPWRYGRARLLAADDQRPAESPAI
ncbi:MAG TPA: class I SAM-dependent methyltransferase, partial [Acidimicrobiia bacterium]